MSEEAMVRNCAPTLAGIKTGNLFSYRYDSTEQMRESLRFWNRRLHDKGVRILPAAINVPAAGRFTVTKQNAADFLCSISSVQDYMKTV